MDNETLKPGEFVTLDILEKHRALRESILVELRSLVGIVTDNDQDAKRVAGSIRYLRRLLEHCDLLMGNAFGVYSTWLYEAAE